MSYTVARHCVKNDEGPPISELTLIDFDTFDAAVDAVIEFAAHHAEFDEFDESFNREQCRMHLVSRRRLFIWTYLRKSNYVLYSIQDATIKTFKLVADIMCVDDDECKYTCI